MTAPTGPARLLDGIGSADVIRLEAHLARWGALPDLPAPSLLEAVDQSGLRGHGGAWFPVGTKWRSVAAGRSPVVVANGAEGEPASGKDRLLLHHAPHLVLDGASVAATAVGSGRVIVHVSEDSVTDVTAALAERTRRGSDRCQFEVVVAPDREQGVGGRPTLVQNVESLAHVALIARYGPGWFRSVGTHDSPGTALVTVTGLWESPRIVEVPLGTTLGSALGITPARAGGIQAVLLGGYGGGWLPTATALSLPFTEEAARGLGTSIGAGVVVLLPTGVCPLVEAARVVRYLEGEGAGQCGPCVNGLDVLATQFELLAHRPHSLRGGTSAFPVLCGLVEGRGACHHPDGVARFVRSALDVFGDHAALHLQRGPCQTTRPFLPVPATAGAVR